MYGKYNINMKRFKAKQKVLINAQAKYYNKKHKPMTYKIDNKVYLNSKNIKSKQLVKKLNYQYYKLYTVSEMLKKQI